MKTGAFAIITTLGLLGGCATAPFDNPHPDRPSPQAPVSSADYARQGHQLAEAGQSAAAMQALNEALRLDRDNPQALFDRAVLHHVAGKSVVALDDIDRAVVVDPENPRVRSARCVIQVAAERNSAGLKNCYHALVMPGPVSEAQTALGQALLLLGRPREALAAFDVALASEPDHLPARYGRGVARQLTGDAAGSDDVQSATRASPAAGRTFAAATLRTPVR